MTDNTASTGSDLDRLPVEHLQRIDERHVVHSWMVQDEYSSEIMTEAEGLYYCTTEGKRFLDFTSQAWFANVGHRNRRVMNAIVLQVEELACVHGLSTRPKLQLTEKLLGLLPGSYERIFYGLNGSDAIEIALKVARLVTGRQDVIAFHDEYHGASMGAASVTGVSRWRARTGTPVPGSIFVPSPYHYRSPLAGGTQEQTDQNTIDYLRFTIEKQGADTIAAVIGEPILTGTPAGGVVPGLQYWRGVRRLCDEYGIMLISDEIVTAFGRTGHWFARDYYGYEPDVICLAKGLTSGYLPLSAAVFRDSVAERFQGRLLPHGLTYTGHPVCCAAALANVSVIEDDGLIENASSMGATLAAALQRLQQDHPCVGDARSLGLFAALELVSDRNTKASFPPWAVIGDGGKSATPQVPMGAQVAAALRNKGIIIRGAGDIIKFAPPLTVSEEEIARVATELDEALSLADKYVGTASEPQETST